MFGKLLWFVMWMMFLFAAAKKTRLSCLSEQARQK
jgi:hypothetical protein